MKYDAPAGREIPPGQSNDGKNKSAKNRKIARAPRWFLLLFFFITVIALFAVVALFAVFARFGAFFRLLDVVV